MKQDVWLTRLRFLLGSGVLAWELLADHLRHWPPIFVLVVWLLGGPLEEVIRFVTAGRISITVRKPDDKDES